MAHRKPSDDNSPVESDDKTLQVSPGVKIDVADLRFVFSRSSGPGGQNVNKVNTRVTLLFDLARCPTLSEDRKARIQAGLANRISQDGVLRVNSIRHRTQAANKQAAVNRLLELLSQALVYRRPRTATAPTRSSQRRRVHEKKMRGDIKKRRQQVSPQD